MARFRENRGDPRRGAGPFANLVKGDVMVDIPNHVEYGNSVTLMDSAVSKTIEDQTSGQEREKGARSGRPRRTGTV